MGSGKVSSLLPCFRGPCSFRVLVSCGWTPRNSAGLVLLVCERRSESDGIRWLLCPRGSQRSLAFGTPVGHLVLLALRASSRPALGGNQRSSRLCLPSFLATLATVPGTPSFLSEAGKLCADFRFLELPAEGHCRVASLSTVLPHTLSSRRSFQNLFLLLLLGHWLETSLPKVATSHLQPPSRSSSLAGNLESPKETGLCGGQRRLQETNSAAFLCWWKQKGAKLCLQRCRQ